MQYALIWKINKLSAALNPKIQQLFGRQITKGASSWKRGRSRSGKRMSRSVGDVENLPCIKKDYRIWRPKSINGAILKYDALREYIRTGSGFISVLKRNFDVLRKPTLAKIETTF